MEGLKTISSRNSRRINGGVSEFRSIHRPIDLTLTVIDITQGEKLLLKGCDAVIGSR
jgi:tRNA (Thr-GGU) A37 N-methylase